ncbi:putative chloride channel protein [Leptomonas pyrrhocoris]|uniref:Chloride channel protein n=1 Tax=Leptomonas pyrrhocoris TaxID=157538 RepID=A0A0M9FTE7_LEPPY|nr:putative chloride channel protein [Leptomonas pyrrhocoris]XP_015654037.1 putative chloride channel protein [Leptomonas pyrrhocoris]KPA75597.1 putative chloride channel protein [Leptomonas pyrrhocoris]KPA75598.1 putative chloride channel protein [Leptomonas pyrrhocoris]|eukprot:XP_015654036.1 putative chloride channel protein [Leptomonas pyrrhocoris]
MRLPASDFGASDVAPPLHERESWLQWLIRTMRETANPNTMHTEDLTPVELEKQASFESLDYYKPYPDMYVEYLRESHESRRHQYLDASSAEGGSRQVAEAAVEMPNRVPPAPSSSASASSPMQQVAESFPMLQMDQDERHAALRWTLHVLIAFSVGIVATFVSYAVDFVEKYRADVLYRVMVRDGEHGIVGIVVGFFYTVLGSVLLTAVAAGVVVYFEPAASGGGIPDVMAYLNGVHLRKAMNLRTFLAKVISCICAVSGGLPVGLEAPLIHLGAITGAGMTQGRSRTLGFQTRLFQAFRNNKDRRDFITAGAACGVSVAFGAPIGGLLFVMEEVSSFWDQSSNGQIFLATMLCFTFSTIINSIVEDRRLLGWVSNAASVLFEVNLTIPLNLVSIVPSLLLGLIIGSMTAFFTKANLILIKWRRRVLRPYPFRRFLEPVVVGAVFSASMFVLSLAAPCAEELEIDDVNDTIHIWGTEGAGRLFNATCAKPHTYSPLGTLNMASGKNTIRHLFSRQTAGEFTVANLLLYFFIYFGFAVLSSGMAVAGGLVVPSLVMGAVFGRLYGLLLFKMGAKEVPGIPNSYATSVAWMDPGLFALIGAGAFLAGTSRMTMAICVIMVELSSELHYLLPVMVAIVMSKSTADWLCEPLYHQMLMMDSVPYLPHNIVKPEFEQLTAADVMASEVVMLRKRERTETVLAALRDSTHHAFPVVEAELDDLIAEEEKEGAPNTVSSLSGGDRKGAHSSSPPPNRRAATSTVSATATTASGARSLDDPSAHIRYKFVGLVTREDLQVYFTLPQLQEYDASLPAPSPTPVPLTADDSDGFGGRLAPCVLAIRKMSWQQWMAQKGKLFFTTLDRYEWVRTHIPDGAPSGADVGAESASFISESRLPPVVDLSLIVNRSPWVIPPFFNLQMAYHTFRMMGLRHMVVVDGDTVTGIITRKDLLVDSLRRRMKELSARLATAGSAAPSLPPSRTNRAYAPHRRGGEAAAEDGGDARGPGIHVLRSGAGTAAASRQLHRQTSAPTAASAWSRLEIEAERWPAPLDAALGSAAAQGNEKDEAREQYGAPRVKDSNGSSGPHQPPSHKLVSPLSLLFDSSSSGTVKSGPGRAVAAADVAPSPSPPPRAMAQQSSKAGEAKDAAALPAKSATTTQKKKPLSPEAAMLFDLSVVKSPREASQDEGGL